MSAIEAVKAMPGDATHTRAALAACVLASIVMCHYEVEILKIFYVAIMFMFGTMYVSPDLDINSKPYQRWGTFRLLWKPYTDYVPHRGRLSHHILIGPIMLCLWMTLLVAAVVTFFMVFWIPFIEPLLDSLRSIVDQVVTLKIEKETWIMFGAFYGIVAASQVFPIIMDKLMKGERG